MKADPSSEQKTALASLEKAGAVKVGPISIVVSTPNAAAESVCALAAAPKTSGFHVHLVNAYSVALADASPDLAGVFTEGGICFSDGRPIYWFARHLKRHKTFRQVRGPALFADTFDRGRGQGIRHFLLGSTPAVLEKLEANLSALYPGIRIVGRISPSFGSTREEDLRDQDEKIRQSGAQIVWVGLGTPKQDFEAARLAKRLPIVAVAVGAAFDFVAGNKKEAPRWLSVMGFEWFFRLGTEPRRLWRRYLIGNVQFLRAVLRRHK